MIKTNKTNLSKTFYSFRKMEDREIQLKLVFTNYEMNFMDQFLNSHESSNQKSQPPP